MALLDGDRFEGRFRDGVHTADVSDLMRRMVKESLLTFDATPLFPDIRASLETRGEVMIDMCNAHTQLGVEDVRAWVDTVETASEWIDRLDEDEERTRWIEQVQHRIDEEWEAECDALETAVEREENDQTAARLEEMADVLRSYRMLLVADASTKGGGRPNIRRVFEDL